MGTALAKMAAVLRGTQNMRLKKSKKHLTHHARENWLRQRFDKQGCTAHIAHVPLTTWRFGSAFCHSLFIGGKETDG